jgi:hypothetical protein
MLTSDATGAYRVTFDRIGRHHDVPPLDTDAVDADHLAVRIFHYVRPRLFSGQVDVRVDLEAGRGWITVGGVRPAGDCLIERFDQSLPGAPTPGRQEVAGGHAP